MSFNKLEIYKAIPIELYNKLMKKEPDNTSIVAMLKPEQKSAAESILNQLWRGDLKWNSTGEINYGGDSMHNSLIWDLISFATSEIESVNTTGLDIFVTALRDLKIPHDLLSERVENLMIKKSIKWIKFK